MLETAVYNDAPMAKWFFFQIELCLMHECATKEKIGAAKFMQFLSN